jgi:hypothetical protein
MAGKTASSEDKTGARLEIRKNTSKIIVFSGQFIPYDFLRVFRHLSLGKEGHMEPQRYFSRDEASDYLKSRGFKVAKQTLAKYAVVGGGPPYRMFGTRVVYDPADLDAWVEQRLTQLRKSTSEIAYRGTYRYGDQTG